MFAIVLAAGMTMANVAPPPHCLIDKGDGEVEYQDPESAVDQCFPSPNGRFVVKVRDGRITVMTTHGAMSAGTMDGGRIFWSPTSNGFAVDNSEGSGQTEIFHYVDVTAPRPRTSLNLRRTAIARFKAVYRCHGKGTYVNTITGGWTADGHVRLVVQDGIHSEGCRHDDDDMVGVIGDPVTGRIMRTLSAAEIRREWCTPAQRADYGYCYEEAAFEAAHKTKR